MSQTGVTLDVMSLEEPDEDSTEKTIQDEPLEEHNKQPGMFESDIKLVEAQRQVLNALVSEEDDDDDDDDGDRLIEKRKGNSDLATRWPQGIVPYKIHDSSK